jgi:hypothetical protein
VGWQLLWTFLKRKAPARGHRGFGEYNAKAIAWGAQEGQAFTSHQPYAVLRYLDQLANKEKTPARGHRGFGFLFGNLCDAREQHHFAQIYMLTGKNHGSRQTKVISRAG